MLRSAITALAKAGSKQLHDTTIQIVRAKVATSGLDKGQPDWTKPPNALGSLLGDVQPAGVEIQQAAGLTVAGNRKVIYSDPPSFAITPLVCRAVIGGVSFTILHVETWPSHTRLLVEAA